MILEGRVALVTGGARGIGAAVGEALAREGAHVVLADLRKDVSAEAAAGLRGKGFDCCGMELDVADRASVERLAARIGAELGPVSILVNNAGIGHYADMDAPEAPDIWDRTIAVNLTGVFNVTRAFLPALKETKGSIVNVSSVVAFTSAFAEAGYVASKGGVRSLTQKMCREFAPFGIRVNAIAPGYIDTDMGPTPDGKTLAWLSWHCPMQRFGRPEEIGGPVVFLVSPAASFVNGVTLPVDGGYLVI